MPCERWKISRPWHQHPVRLGNFGPETPTSLLLQRFGGVSMAVAAAEDGDLIQGRGDNAIVVF